MFPGYLEVEKNWFLAISNLTNTVSAIWRDKKVDPCYLETKKFSSKLLYIWRPKNVVHNCQEQEKIL